MRCSVACPSATGPLFFREDGILGGIVAVVQHFQLNLNPTTVAQPVVATIARGAGLYLSLTFGILLSSVVAPSIFSLPICIRSSSRSRRYS